MLDLHLTPYDLKSVHEYQISNDKKLSKILKIVEKVLSENAELKMVISGLSEKLNNLQSALRNNASSILQPLPATSSSFFELNQNQSPAFLHLHIWKMKLSPIKTQTPLMKSFLP